MPWSDAEAGTSRMDAPPVVVGGMVLDVQAASSGPADVQRGGSVPGSVQQAAGGVARNIAACLATLCKEELRPLLISLVGQDAAGATLTQQWSAQGLSTRGITVSATASTPAVCTIFDKGGEVVASVADCDSLEAELTPAVLSQHRQAIAAAPLLVLDANLAAQTIEAASQIAAASGVPVWFEPVSVPKSARATKVLHLLHYVSPNALELVAMANSVRLQAGAAAFAWRHPGAESSAAVVIHSLSAHLQTVLQAGVKVVVLTLGAQGAAICKMAKQRRSIEVAHMPALPTQVVNLSGAGDCLVAGTVASLLGGSGAVDALAYGMAVARCAVESLDNVPGQLDLVAVQASALGIQNSLMLLELPLPGL